MRALLAGLFTFGGLLVCVGYVYKHFPDGFGPPWLMGIFFALVLFVLAGISLLLFNRKGQRPPWPGKSYEEQVAEWEQQGLLESQTFQATRAFEVAEFEDEGSHYFIELVDGSVLYLDGQYLYDYQEITEDGVVVQKQTFPCTHFTVRRHKQLGYVVDIRCEGTVLQPECETPAFTRRDAKADLIPEDGDVIRHKTYDQLKAERQRAV